MMNMRKRKRHRREWEKEELPDRWVRHLVPPPKKKSYSTRTGGI
ncbi:hypothetical protein ES702_04943 [subsurface metagenome]